MMRMEKVSQARDFIDIQKYILPKFLLDFYNDYNIDDNNKKLLTDIFVINYLDDIIYRNNVQGKYICFVKERNSPYLYEYIGVRTLSQIQTLPYQNYRIVCIEIGDNHDEIVFYQGRKFTIREPFLRNHTRDEEHTISNIDDFVFDGVQNIKITLVYLDIIQNMDLPKHETESKYNESVLDLIIKNSKLYTQELEDIKMKLLITENL
jgi:hypothetical protein